MKKKRLSFLLRMVMNKSVMLDIFSGGDKGSDLEIDTESDNSGQINRSNRNVWDEQL